MDPEVRQKGPGACPKCGMALEPEMPVLQENPSVSELATMTRRFWASVILSVPVAALAMVSERSLPSTAHAELILTTLILFGAGWAFIERAWRSLINRSLNMFSLIVMGTGSAYFYSLWVVLSSPAWYRLTRPLYFESAAVITTRPTVPTKP